MSFTAKRVVRESQEVWEIGWDEWIADGEYSFTVVARLWSAIEAALLCHYLNGGNADYDIEKLHVAHLLGQGIE